MSKQLISKAVGIDLGTTNSVVAVMTPADTEIVVHRIAGSSRRETTPSCVWKDPRSQQKIVGSKAFQRIGSIPEPIRSIKRSMGKQVSVQLGDEQLTPEEVSALILQEMKRQIEEDVARFATETSEWIVDRAIVTVPAYFDAPQIEATRKAAALAGLRVLELLHEPTAAACYYCYENKVQNGTFLVYDFGGGTFDVSILRCVEGAFEVLGISGNNRLGGDDIDSILAEELRQRLVSEGYELEFDPQHDDKDRQRLAKLKHLAEGLKKALSTEDEHLLRSQSDLQDKAGEPIEIDMLFERSEVEELMSPLIERTLSYCYQALDLANQKAGVTLADIDAIILAGGTTHIPLVREIVRQTFCADPTATEPRAKCTQPVYRKVDTIVALGAAIRAAAASGLEVYDTGRAVKILFRGIGSTSARQATLGGRVEALAPGLDLTGGFVQLRVDELGYEDEQDLQSNSSFGFTRVPLQSGAENLLTFEVFGSTSKRVATVTRSLFQSSVSPGLVFIPGTAVLSKALYLEVSHNGRPYRKELVPALATLPTHKEDVFFHPGNTNRLRLPLYQQKKIIKEIIIDNLPPYPKDTPINFTLTVNELAGITVKGEVGKVPFEAQIEIPPDPKPPMPNEVQALEDAFRSAAQKLPDGKRQHIEVQYERAQKSYETATQRGDSEQAIHEFEEMKELAASIEQTRIILEPPLEDFETLVDECLYFNQYLDAYLVKSKHNAVEEKRHIETLFIQGKQAFVNEDQISYANALASLNAIHDRLAVQYYSILREQDTRSESEKAEDLVKAALEEFENVDRRSADRGDAASQNKLARLRDQVQAIARDIPTNPLIVTSRLREIWNELQQIKNSLQGLSNTSQKDDGAIVVDKGTGPSSRNR